MISVKTWDVIVVGGGIIGLSLAIALRKRGAVVLVVERGEPGREASYAAGGMLVDCSLETPPALQSLGIASARMYPEFAHEIEVESGAKVDLRDYGTIVIPPPEPVHERPGFTLSELLPAPLANLNPLSRKLQRFISRSVVWIPVHFRRRRPKRRKISA